MSFIGRAKEHKALTVIALIHWAISFVTDGIFFDYVRFDMSGFTGVAKTCITYGTKLVFLGVLLFLYHGAYVFFKESDRDYRKYVLIYACFNLFLLFLTWPGIWRMDEFGVLNSASLLLPVFWQNYLTSVFYILSIMLIPVPSGVIIVQIILISLLAGAVVRDCEKLFGPVGIMSFIPFFFFPVLDSNLYPMRMSLYAFMELWLLVRLTVIWHEGKGFDESKKKPGYMPLVLMAAIVTVWRTEAIYYLILFPVALLVIDGIVKKKITKTGLRIIVIFLVITIPLFAVQKIGDKLTSSNQYDLTSVMLPLVPLVDRADENSDRDELAAIDKVVSVDEIKKTASEGKSGINLFWSSLYDKTGYSDEEYASFKRAYYSLIKKYPDVFVSERADCFISSNDLLQNTTEIFDPGMEDVPNYESFKSYAGTKPFNSKVRNMTVSFLELRSAGDYNEKKAGYPLVYGAILPIIFLSLIWIASICKRSPGLFLISSLSLARVPLVFLTAPSRLFMYYYSVYIAGWMALFFIVAGLVKKLDDKKGGIINKTLVYMKRNGIKNTIEEVSERLDDKHVDGLTKKASEYKGNRDFGNPGNESVSVSERKDAEKDGPLISIIVPAYRPSEGFFKALLDSVAGQIYGNYELIVADGDADGDGELKTVMDAFVSGNEDINRDKFRYLPLEKNDGISENTNAAVRAAKGDYIALLDHDDILTKDALYEMAKAIKSEEEAPVFLYSDEDKCDPSGEFFFEPNFKPDLDRELLLSNNYICHLLVIRKEEALKHPLRKEFDGAQDYDLVLRLVDDAGMQSDGNYGKILHVPYVLYHWRTHDLSTAGNTDSKDYAYEAGLKALKEHFKRAGLEDKVKIRHSRHLGFYETRYIPDLLDVRKDIDGICGLVVKDGVVIGGPKRFLGLKEGRGGYLHRARFFSEVSEEDIDERALKLRDEEDKAGGNGKKKIVYDPGFVIYEQNG